MIVIFSGSQLSEMSTISQLFFYPHVKGGQELTSLNFHRHGTIFHCTLESLIVLSIFTLIANNGIGLFNQQYFVHYDVRRVVRLGGHNCEMSLRLLSVFTISLVEAHFALQCILPGT